MRIYLHSPLENKLSDGFVWYAHTDGVGILPGEEMVCADITISVISTDNTPSGNTHIQNAKREWFDERTGHQRQKKKKHPYGNQPRLSRSPQETTRLCFEPMHRRALR